MTEAAASHDAPAAQGTPSRFLVRVALVFLGWDVVNVAVLGAIFWSPFPWWAGPLAFLVAVAPLPVLLSNFREHAYPGVLTRVLVMRPFWYVQLSLPLLTLAGVVGLLVGLPFGAALAAARVAVAGMAAVVVLGAVAGYLGSRRLVVKRQVFAFPDLPAAFDGVTVAQLSDLHVGPHTSARFLARIVRAVEEAKPDLIAFTGDQVDDYDQDVARFAQVFGGLRAPLGVHAIAGNHDVYAGWPGVRAGMEGAGMRVLVNDAEPLRRGGDELWIVGTGDPAGAQGLGAMAPEAAPDVPRALARVPPGAFTLALAHNPALWPALAQRGVHLTLSGHTHHGQISIPALNWCLASPFVEHAMGVHERGGSKLHINPGTNHWGLPLRLGAWPEVTLVTLRRA
jgi:predicted MPP superfamily phosphohydrolase